MFYIFGFGAKYYIQYLADKELKEETKKAEKRENRKRIMKNLLNLFGRK